MKKLIITIFAAATAFFVPASDIAGSWRPCDSYDCGYRYTFGNDGRFLFTATKNLSLNSVAALSGRYEYTDSTITFFAEKYLEKTPDNFCYDSEVKDWIFKEEKAEWKTLDKVIESECEFSTRRDTIFILRLPYIRVQP